MKMFKLCYVCSLICSLTLVAEVVILCCSSSSNSSSFGVGDDGGGGRSRSTSSSNNDNNKHISNALNPCPICTRLKK